MSKNRRVQNRLEPCELTTASLHDSSLPPAYGVLSNISELGLCLETDTFFAPSQDVKILICLNPPSMLIQVQSRIAWTRSKAKRMDRPEESFLLGAKIVWMPDPDRRCLHWALSSTHFKSEPSVDAAYLDHQDVPRLISTEFDSPERPQNGFALKSHAEACTAAAIQVGAQNQAYHGTVLIIRQNIPFVGRLCRLVNIAGFNAVLTSSPDTVISKVRALRPSLVLLSQHIGSPGVSETARRIKTHSGHLDTPVAILTDHHSSPYLLEHAYPVEAHLPIDGDETDLIQNIRFVALKRRRRRNGAIKALEGSIKSHTLSEVLHYLSMAGKTGCVKIEASRRIGRIYLDQGDMVHARLGPLDGIEACHSILGFLQEGYFKFEPDVHPSRTTMRENGVELILRAAEEMDEHRRRVRPEFKEYESEST